MFLDVKDKFPRFNEFVEFKKQMDPDNVFTNEFWERISAEKLSSDILNKINSKGCVENDTCYCSDDLHCGFGTRCMEGRFFKEARICR